jgi:hypothetical protein
MQEDTPAGASQKDPAKSGTVTVASGRTLLAIFERPPEAQDNEVNPAVMIAIESRGSYPQLKTAADYFGPLAEIAEQRGLKIDGGPYSFTAGGKALVRGDFSSAANKAGIRQTSLVLLEKGYILSFTFLSGSEDEIDGLIENLGFISASRKITR